MVQIFSARSCFVRSGFGWKLSNSGTEGFAFGAATFNIHGEWTSGRVNCLTGLSLTQETPFRELSGSLNHSASSNPNCLGPWDGGSTPGRLEILGGEVTVDGIP